MTLKKLSVELLVIVFPLLSIAQADSLYVTSEFDTPSNGPWGLTFRGENLWLSDDSNNSIYEINTIGEVLDSLYVSNCKIRGLTFENESLWIVNDRVIGDTLIHMDTTYVFPFYQILKIDKDTGTKLDSIKFVGACAGHAPLWGITYYNSKFYVSFDGGWGPCLYEIDPIKKIATTLCCTHPCGMAVINDTIWCVRMNSLDGPGNFLVPLKIQNGSSQESWDFLYDIDFYASDIAYDGENIWLCDRYSKKIKKMSKSVTSVEHEISSNIPIYPELYQNYPNPFNPETNIEYCLPEAVTVRVEVYNTLGQTVDVLVEPEKEAGHHRIFWRGENVASGVYFYRLQAGDFTSTKRMVLMK